MEIAKACAVEIAKIFPLIGELDYDWNSCIPSGRIENISKQLDKLVAVAKKKGLAIGIGHVKGNTLKVLEEEIPALVEQGFEFKFLSQVVDWYQLNFSNLFFIYFCLESRSGKTP